MFRGPDIRLTYEPKRGFVQRAAQSAENVTYPDYRIVISAA